MAFRKDFMEKPLVKRPIFIDFLIAVGLTALYYISGKVSFSVSVSHNIVTLVVFAAEGVSLAAALIYGPKAFFGIFAGQFILAVSNGLYWPLSLAISFINAFEVIVAYKLFQYFNLDRKLLRLKDIVGLLLTSAFILQVMSATLGNAVLYLGGVVGKENLLSSWAFWWFGNLMGQMIFAPLVLSLFSNYSQDKRGSFYKSLGLIFITAPIIYFFLKVSFHSGLALPLSIFLPLLIFSSHKGGLFYSTQILAILTGITLYLTKQGEGPFFINGAPNLFELNLFLFGLSFSSHFTSVLFEERSIMINELKKISDENEKVVLAKTQFLSNMSHELRTPLNAVVGISSYMLEDKNLNDQSKYYLKSIKNAGQVLSCLVEDILEIDNILKNQVKFDNIHFDVLNVVADICYIFNEESKKRNFSFFWDIPNESYIVEGDPTKLKKILVNILTNVFSYSDHGEIILKSSIEKYKEDNYKLKVSISDDGLGMSDDFRKNVFNSIKHEGVLNDGKGFGLLTSDRLLKLMGKNIEIDATISEGVTISFDLDYKEGKIVTVEDPDDYIDLTGMKVLIAEDSEVNIIVLSSYMKKMNSQVTVAKNGAQALMACEKENFDFILMDIQMPILDGVEATKLLREKGISTPIIAVTANAFDDDLKKYLSIGINDCVVKPIKIQKLVAAIRKNLFKDKAA